MSSEILISSRTTPIESIPKGFTIVGGGINENVGEIGQLLEKSKHSKVDWLDGKIYDLKDLQSWVS